MKLLRSDLALGIVLLLGAVTGTWGTWAAIHRAPLEKELLASQKIFYFHMPLGVWTLIGMVLSAAAAALYLWRRDPRKDLFCAATMEVSTIACAVVIITGSIWAHFAWGDWFPWGEPRVTSMLALFLVGLAYFVLRSSVTEPDKRARFSCVLAVVAAADSVLALVAIHIWNTTHPRVMTVGADGVKVALDPLMLEALEICAVATALIFWPVLALRYRLACLAADLERAEHEAADLELEAS